MPLSGDPLKITDSFALTTFTPSWVGLTLGSGAVNEGWYRQVGDFVHWGFRYLAGTSPAFTATIVLTLPVTAYTGSDVGSGASLGAWMMRSSGAANYAGTIQNFVGAGTDCCLAGAWNGSSPSARVGLGTNTPVSLAAGMVISGTGTYRAA